MKYGSQAKSTPDTLKHLLAPLTPFYPSLLNFGFLPMAHGSLATSTAPKRRLFLVAAAKPPQLKIFSLYSFASPEVGLGDFSAHARKKAKLQGGG
jgi:hypothetical protein